ncbi:MAG: hypothetical protein U1E53_16385 [Dongiaceae bacterium]
MINAADRLFVLAQPAGGVLAEPLPATDLRVRGGRISFAVPAATLRPAMAFDGAYVPAAIEGVLSTIQDNGDATTRSVKLRRVTDAAQGFPDCRPPQPAVTASASSSSGVDQRANLPAPPTCSSREQLVGIAASYVARHWPSESDETSTLKPILFDRGKVWEVLYELPPGTLGGRPSCSSTRSPARSSVRSTSSDRSWLRRKARLAGSWQTTWKTDPACWLLVALRGYPLNVRKRYIIF